jgi:predicted metal-dependent enzyme (double-stranded beta helix superfamily)
MHLAIARRHAADPDTWPFAPRFDPLRRWYHRLAVEPGAEVWLLTWLPGQETDLHDHGGSAGAFVVVRGQLVEHTVAPDIQLRPTTLVTGAGRSFGPHHIHRLGNASSAPAVSVHVYSPALTTMNRYHLDDEGLRVASVDRAGVQW